MAPEIRRLYFIVRTFLSYGLDELFPKMRITLPLRLWRHALFSMPNRHKDRTSAAAASCVAGARPGLDKFGKCSQHVANLSGHKLPISLPAIQGTSPRLMPSEQKNKSKQRWAIYPIETRFYDSTFSPGLCLLRRFTPRVKREWQRGGHQGIRPDILPVIRADMKLIYRPARWMPRLLPDGRRSASAGSGAGV
ncbi:hypothetical protein ACNKHO_24550 [Shigella flexneri]